MENPSADRFGSFFDRVNTERQALRIVNLTFGKQKLHGLTESAISTWEANTQKKQVGEQSDISLISGVLRRLSARIDALADQSRTVFSGERLRSLPSHDILLELENTCRSFSSQ